MSDFVPQVFKKTALHHQPTGSVVYPASSATSKDLMAFPGGVSYSHYQEDIDPNYNQSIAQVQSQQLPHQPYRGDSYSLQFQSIGSRSAHGYNSNYMLNENVLSQGDFDAEAYDGSQSYNPGGTVDLPIMNMESATMQLERPHTPQFQEFMTETEVRDIVRKFNESLNKHTIEQVDLEKKVQYLIERIDDKQDIIRSMYKEKENIMLENENISLVIEKVKRNQEQLQMHRDKSLQLSISDQQEDLEIKLAMRLNFVENLK